MCQRDACNVTSTAANKQVTPVPEGRACLSCGTRENMRRRKYCSVACRQRLPCNVVVLLEGEEEIAEVVVRNGWLAKASERAAGVA